ncbi:hypothetical protein GTY41_19690 [Streptomyces sp. SID685]|uniref:hypothetical protein n=1 Tax=Streptomyces TaxID=1883 RepID=UPI0013712EBB|nr:hypothetical protein [Streptomyces sp. SID685]MYR87109.1 hypothetical protein [Streptomyces sp. SID685]
MSIRHSFRACTGTPVPPLRITIMTVPGKARVLRLDGEVDQYRPELVDGCLATTGLTLED